MKDFYTKYLSHALKMQAIEENKNIGNFKQGDIYNFPIIH